LESSTEIGVSTGFSGVPGKRNERSSIDKVCDIIELANDFEFPGADYLINLRLLEASPNRSWPGSGQLTLCWQDASQVSAFFDFRNKKPCR
jgi:hypothetical protein